jgi:O-antigen/teichoic acid export membrane protein
MMDASPQAPIYSRITSNALYSLKGNLMTSGSLFVMNLVLARTFSPLDLSLIFIVMSVTGISMALAELGIPQAITVKLSERISKGVLYQGVENIRSIIISSFSLGLTIAFLFALGLMTISGLFPFGQENNLVSGALKISSWWILFSSILKLSQGVFSGFQEMRYSFLLNITSEPFKLLAALVALFFGFYWKELIWGWTVVYLFSSLFCMILLILFLNKKRVGLMVRMPQCKKEILVQGLLLYSPVLGSFLIPYMMNLILAKHGVEDVSFFALTFSLTSVYFVIFNAFSLAFLPAATQLMVQKDRERLATIVVVGVKYIGLGGFVILLTFYFLSDTILNILYGAQYVKAGPLLQLLAFGVFFDIFKTIYDPLLMGTRHGGTVTLIEWIKFGMVLLFSPFAIERFGLLGTGIVLFVSFMVASCLKIFFIDRYLSIKLFKPMGGIGCLAGGLLLYHFSNIPFPVILVFWIFTVFYFKLWIWREVKYMWSLVHITSGKG